MKLGGCIIVLYLNKCHKFIESAAIVPSICLSDEDRALQYAALNFYQPLLLYWLKDYYLGISVPVNVSQTM